MDNVIMIIPAAVLAVNAYRDIKKHLIFPVSLIAAAVAGGLYRLLYLDDTVMWILLSLMPGMLVLSAAFLSREQIGKGDALAVFAAGSWAGAFDIWKIMIISSVITFGFAAVIWFKKRKNVQIPFVPFLTAGFLIYILL